ncbi:MAG: hypothetical protein KAS04_04125 [Candidatus Aenigmarchaeota archaeon]|nr:hypothetical protein [Candidatus Aenigmarchaeota archaeon]
MLPYDIFSLEIMLPFFLVLAIVFGALEVSQVFSNKAVKAIIAFVFAAFSVMNMQVVAMINFLLPYAAGFFVLFFLVWIILKPLRGKGGDGKGDKKDPLILIVVLVLVLVIMTRLGDTGYSYSLGFLANPNLLWIIGIVVVVFIIYKAYKMGA